MVNRALNQGVEADYLLVDSWYAKPDFITQASELGMPVIARIANHSIVFTEVTMGKSTTRISIPLLSMSN